MPNYEIEARGDVREIYNVYAESKEEAIAKWEHGKADLYLSETQGTEIVRVEEGPSSVWPSTR